MFEPYPTLKLQFLLLTDIIMVICGSEDCLDLFNRESHHMANRMTRARPGHTKGMKLERRASAVGMPLQALCLGVVDVSSFACRLVESWASLATPAT